MYVTVNAGFDAEDQREVNCSENESSDTTDEEQVKMKMPVYGSCTVHTHVLLCRHGTLMNC